ncbi:hypothetical protein ACWD1Z_29345 [Streptomyces sp. NPDC002784]
MTITPRQRFSVRVGLASVAGDGPYDGVADHLLVPLQHWLLGALHRKTRGEFGPESHPDEEMGRVICLRLRIAADGVYSPAGSMYVNVLAAQEGVDLLDAVDALLAYRVEHGTTNPTELTDLTKLLDEGGSAYRITDALDGLEERVMPAVRDAIRQTIADAASNPSAGSSADHLATAWSAAYGRRPDAVRAYSEAIKAVECAAHAIIQPNHTRATLGTMLGELKGAARPKFTTALTTAGNADPIAPVEALMRALWDGQTSRHGKQTTTVPETLAAARAGVHLAATLVQWFSSGAVARTP